MSLAFFCYFCETNFSILCFIQSHFFMKNILYIHGFNSNADSYTGNKLKELFPQYNWFLDTFNLVDVEETIHRIISMIKELEIDTIVSSSLGCVYNLYVKKGRSSKRRMPNKILINPCCIPSEVLPTLAVLPPKAKEYCEAMEDNLYKYHEDNTPGYLFGIFGKDDEVVHYHDFFEQKYGASDGSNCIWVDGGHAHLDEKVLKDSMLKAFAYFDRVEQKSSSATIETKPTNWADPQKPFYNPNPGRKPILYFDMDDTLVDFASGLNKIDALTRIRYNSCLDCVPNLFSLMDPLPGAVEAFKKLSQHFDTFILSTSPWGNQTAANDKLNWVKKYLGAEKGSPAYKRLILSHHKDLNIGDFLIDDRPMNNGADKFSGLVIPFGKKHGLFPDWDSVLHYLLPLE